MREIPAGQPRKAKETHWPGCSPTPVEACMFTLGVAGTDTVDGTAGGFFGPKGVAVARSKRAKATL